MFSHVNVGARDLPRLAAFYDAVLAPLGLARAGDGEDRRPARAAVAVPGATLAAVLRAAALGRAAGHLG